MILYNQDPLFWAAYVPVILLALSVHEYAHAITAKWCGDDTAEREGRVTLNPLAHLDPLGTLCLLFGPFGWARPVPVNPRNLRNPRWDDVLISGAGPLSNLIQVPIYAILGVLVLGDNSLSQMLSENWLKFFAYMIPFGMIVNLSLMLFNLLPIFPLDGSHILKGFLPWRLVRPYEEFQYQYGSIVLLGLMLISWNTNIVGAYIRFFSVPIMRLLGVPIG